MSAPESKPASFRSEYALEYTLNRSGRLMATPNRSLLRQTQIAADSYGFRVIVIAIQEVPSLPTRRLCNMRRSGTSSPSPAKI